MDSSGNAGRLRLICNKEDDLADVVCGRNKDDDKDNKDDKDYNKDDKDDDKDDKDDRDNKDDDRSDGMWP